MKNFEGSEKIVIGLSSKKWAILHSQFYVEYEYSHHNQNIFISFEHTVSSERSRFTLAGELVN